MKALGLLLAYIYWLLTKSIIDSKMIDNIKKSDQEKFPSNLACRVPQIELLFKEIE